MSCSFDGFDELQLQSLAAEHAPGTAYGMRGPMDDGCGSLHDCSAPCPPCEWRLPLIEGVTLRILRAVATSPRTLNLSCMRV